MRVVIVNPSSELVHALYRSGAKLREDLEGLLIHEVIEIRKSKIDRRGVLTIYCIDKNNELISLGLTKKEFTEIRVYM